MRQAAYAFLVLACLGRLAFADTWIFPPKLNTKSFEFGKSMFVLEIDGTKDRSFPPHTLSIYLDGELKAKYKNVGFEKVYASRDHKFFVGASNSGIPGTAFVVFDAEGNLLREEKHCFLPDAIYTFQSTTFIRTWFDAKKPDIEFNVQGRWLRSVFLSGSNGQKYDLMEPDLGFRDDE